MLSYSPICRQQLRWMVINKWSDDMDKDRIAGSAKEALGRDHGDDRQGPQ
jgi:hypothetical protein